MGRVRTNAVKRAARQIVELHHKKLTRDFQMNKKIAIEVAEIPSKRLRNKIAGYVTHLMRRIESGPVRGISLQLQEAEREKRMNDDAKVSEIDLSNIMVDPSTYAMVDAMGLKRCDNIKMVDKSFSEVYAI